MSIKHVDTLEPNGPFPIVRDAHIEGGFRVVNWDSGVDPAINTHLNNQVPVADRKLGMIVRVRDTVAAGLATLDYMYSDTNTWIPNNLGDKFDVGIESGFGISTVGLVTSFAAGTFYDTHGNKVTRTATTAAPAVAGANTVHAIFWNPTARAFQTANLTSGGSCNPDDLPFAVVVVDGAGTAISLYQDVRRFADGQYNRRYVTVGSSSGFNRCNFSGLRYALLHIQCFNPTLASPREILVVDNFTEPTTAGEDGCIKFDTAAGRPWAKPERLSGITIRGHGGGNSFSTQISPGKPTITWTSSVGPVINFNGQPVNNFKIENLAFDSAGSPNTADRNRCLFRNPALGFICRDVVLYGAGTLSHVCSWSTSTVQLNSSSVIDNAGVLFDRFSVSDPSPSGNDGLFFFGEDVGDQVSAIYGSLTIQDSQIVCDSARRGYAVVSTDVEASTDTDSFSVTIRNSRLDDITNLFASTTNAKRNVENCSFKDIGNVIGNMTDCLFVTTNANTVSVNDPGVTRISHSKFSKSNSDAQSNTIFDVSGGAEVVELDHCTFEYTGASTNADPMIKVFDTDATLSASHCTANVSGTRASQSYLIEVTGTGAPILAISDCDLECNIGLLYAVKSVTGGNISIDDCRVSINGSASTVCNVDIGVNTDTIYWDDCSILDNTFIISPSASSVTNINRVKKLSVCGNKFVVQDGTEHSMNIGENGGGNGQQDSVTFSGNTFSGSGDIKNLYVYLEAYKQIVADSNTIGIYNSTSTFGASFVSLGITGDGSTSLSASASNNSLICDGSGAGINTYSELDADDVISISLSGNNVYADGDGSGSDSDASIGAANITSTFVQSVSITGGSVVASAGAGAAAARIATGWNASNSGLDAAIVISGVSVEASAAGGAASSIDVQLARGSGLDGSVAVSSNTVKSRGGTSATYTAAIDVSGGTSIAVNGNTLDTSSTFSLGSQATISLFDNENTTHAAVVGNVLRKGTLSGTQPTITTEDALLPAAALSDLNEY